MAQKATEVLKIYVPSAGFTLKVRSCIDGKQKLYAQRIAADAQEFGDADDAEVDYSANTDCVYYFGDDTPVEFRVGSEPISRAPVFFETTYFFRGSFDTGCKPVKDVVVDHRMASVTDSFTYDENILSGQLDFINEPGLFRLDIKIVYQDNTEKTLRFEFMVVSVKMNVKRDYHDIVTTIDEYKPNIVQQFLSKTFWGASLDSEKLGDDTSWYEILCDVFDYYYDACKRIVNNPHRSYITEEEWLRADQIKRWSPMLVNQYARMNSGRRMTERLRTERVVAVCDTAENRFVLYTLKRLEMRLKDFSKRVQEIYRNEPVSKTWMDGIAKKAEQLKKLSKHPFFKGVGAFEGFRQQSLVMQKKSGYAQILTAWLKLKLALKPGGDDIDIGYRPISTLYEFWCFITVQKQLEEVYGKANVKWNGGEIFFKELTDDYTGYGEALNPCVAEFVDGNRKILLSYQKTYSASGVGEDDTSAGLNPQRPDIVLSIVEGDNVFTYLFDAKYRIVSRQVGGVEIDASQRAAIDDMHRYRDAILYRLQKQGLHHEIIGAYVLYPGRPEPHLCKEYDKSIAEENIGAIPLLPRHLEQLKLRLGDIIKRHTAADHLATAIPTRGTTMVVGEAISEDSIPTIKLEPSEWPDFKTDKLGVPASQNDKIVKIPMIVRLDSNNQPAIYVKILRATGNNKDGVHEYAIKWTAPGSIS